MSIPGKLGIDIGKVIIAGDSSGDTSFLGSSLEAAMRSPAADRAFEVIAELTRAFEGRVWLISKCGPSVQAKTRAWLLHHRFYDRTAVAEQNLRFCLERSQKAIHCRQLGMTHFIDDRQDVLGYLRGLVPKLYLFGPQRSSPPNWVIPVASWLEVKTKLLQGPRAPADPMAPSP